MYVKVHAAAARGGDVGCEACEVRLSYIYVCMYTYIHTCIRTYAHMRFASVIYVCMYTYIHTCIHTYAHMRFASFISLLCLLVRLY